MRIVSASLPTSWLITAVLAVLVSWWIVMRVRRGMGVWRLRFYAFPRPWLKYLHAHVPLYERLPWELRAPYQDKVLQFVDAKAFRACGRINQVTEEMRVAIAGNACLLLLNGSGEENFPGILTVNVYAPEDPDAGVRSSCVAMRWDVEKMQAAGSGDKENAALPAIALKLGWGAGDQPALPDTLLLTAWARVRSAEFHKRHPGVLEKAMGAVPGSVVPPGDTIENPQRTTESASIFDPPDVFAIATEMFLGVPAVLQQRQPELYAAMRQFYQIDPARWKAQQ